MTIDKKPYKRIQGKVIHELSDEERSDAAKKIATKEWNAKLEEKRNAKSGIVKNKKRVNKTQGKVILGTTAEERFKEIHGRTIEEWQEINKQNFKAKTGVTPEEWYLKKVESSTPLDYLHESMGAITTNDIKLVKELQDLGLIDGVINVLLNYAVLVSRNGLVHPLVLEMGKSWFDNDIVTIVKAIVFVREELEKNKY